MFVAPASNEFSSSSFKAIAGLKITYVFDNFEMGKTKYTNLAQKLRPYVKLQSYEKVIDRREPEFPEFTKGPNGGVWAPMKSATTKIAQCVFALWEDLV